MSQNTQEIIETVIGNSNYNTKTMKSEDNGEVQYVYEDSQMVLGGTDDFNNITDLILEDGTRAMIVNGTLVTADGQTLILQDGSDLSQYYVDDNTDEILLSQEEEKQFLGIISPENNSQAEETVVEYVQGEANGSCNREEILYIHDGDQVIPVQEQYQLADGDTENNVLPMQQVIEGMDGVIDLEQLLNQQGLLQVETGNNYQYAILKDGKFHIQTMNEPTNVGILKHQNTSNVNGESILESSAESSYLNLSLIKDKYGVYNAPSGSNVGLKNLINKKIIIGKTDKGKMLIGKIINVTKKTEASNNTFKKKKGLTLKKKITLPLKNKKNKLNLGLKNEVINLVDDDETEELQNESACTRTSNPTISPVPIISEQNNDSNLPPFTPSNTEWSKRSNIPVTLQSKSASNISPIAEHAANKVRVKTYSKSQNSTRDQNCSNVGSSPEQSKIVVHKKVVTKDCFEVITRTLTGLMNMESVVKKLRNKTIIIKIIEKSYDLDAEEYSKSVSYCTGYMVRECQLNDTANSFSESWKFIPDANSQDTILREDNLEAVFPDPVTGKNSLKRIANLTIQITINSQGSRTTRVIINPPNMYKCKECTKSFRTSSALKVHTNDCHSPVSLECTTCSVKFKNHQDSKEHFLIHQVDNNQGMYECMECNKRFGSSLLLRRHMDIHFKPVNCWHCNQSFSSMRDLKRHLAIHEPIVPEPTPVPAILRKGPYDSTEVLDTKPYEQKIYCCHICGRQFSRHSNLQRHIEIHQGEGAMYKCAICSCSYHYVSSLTRHVVTCHVDTTNKRSQKNIEVKQEESNPKSDLQFVQEDEIVEMMQLEDMSVENVQYVHVAENLSIGEGVEVLQIPVDQQGIVIDD